MSPKETAVSIATELQRHPDTRSLSPELRLRFIEFREELIQVGIYDPVLGRFDSYTAPQAEPEAIAKQLFALAETL